MPPKGLRRPPEAEVLRRWEALSNERKQALMTFADPMLVERIEASLQALFEKQQFMQNLGIKLGNDTDPFLSSTLFTSAFEFTWQIGRSTRDPSLVLVDPSRMPVMVVKPAFLESDTFFQDLRAVIPDLLSERSSRAQLPRPRWKELWATDPASIAAMEQQLVKLVEQALWVVGSDHAYEVRSERKAAGDGNHDLPSVGGVADALAADSVPFEPWMVDEYISPSKAGDKKKKKKKKREKGRALSTTPSVEAATEAATTSSTFSSKEEAQDDGQSQSVMEEEEEPAAEPSIGTPGVVEEGEEELAVASDDEESIRGPVYHESTMPPLPPSDDESECMGTSTVMAAPCSMCVSPDNAKVSLGGISSTPTAASTPAQASFQVNWGPGSVGRRKTPMPAPDTPPVSPMAAHRAMHPPQLVCYVWNQTSQFERHQLDSPRHAHNSGAVAAAESSAGNSAAATPGVAAQTFSRGQWMGPGPSTPATPLGGAGSPPSNVLSAVVRNTFVDINDPSQRSQERPRTSRSWSPAPVSCTPWADVWHESTWYDSRSSRGAQ